jgi:hypothetical protein
MASAAAAVAGSTNMIGGGAAPTKAGSSGVESLPKEMNEMKLRDDKVDHHGDDKVGTGALVGFVSQVMPCGRSCRRCEFRRVDGWEWQWRGLRGTAVAVLRATHEQVVLWATRNGPQGAGMS